MRTLAALLSLLWLGAATARASEPTLATLTPQEVLAKLKQKNFYVFDNNDKERYQKSHVPGAKWVHPSEFAAGEMPADKTATLVFYCASPH